MAIGYISDQRLATYSAARTLNRIFGQANVMPITSSSIDKKSIKEFELIFFPGIYGEKSICDELLNPEQRDLIFREVYDNALALWTDCNWTYRISRTTQYEFIDGTHESWDGYNWIDAHTEGPALGADKATTQDRYHLQLANITFYQDDKECQLQLACHNGPGLIVNKDNPDIKIIADYDGLTKAYTAAMTQRIGNGLIVAQGVLSHITADHMIGRFNNHEKEHNRAHIESRLRHHHDAIINLQDQLASEIKPYMEQRHAHPA